MAQGKNKSLEPTDENELELKIHELNAEIIELRAQVFKLRDEIHAIRNSRIVGKIIKFREWLGRLPQTVRNAFHAVRVIGAPMVPPRLRRSLKRIYKAVRHILRHDVSQHLKTSKIVTTERWTGGSLVSVVIPYYNRADTIDDTLNSLQAQTFTDFETILVDDGSTDPLSIEKLDLLKKDHTHIRFLWQENQGVAAARNYGIAKANGKYIICLDSDDMLDPTFIEKAVVLLETQPDVSIASSWMEIFGVLNERFQHNLYDPLRLYKNNMIITAAAFRKTAWEKSGGYKSNLGYEDWDFWLTLTENGYWARQIPETLFLYRSSMQSRYVEDKDVHWGNLKRIRGLHPKYKFNVKRHLTKQQYIENVIDPATAFMNIDGTKQYKSLKGKPNILITIPWMTFGGAETLIYNYCREIYDDFTITFMTGLKSDHEWEYKFREITPYVYHLANLFDDTKLYVEFISNYITTRHVDVLHIIHNGFTFEMLAELKRRHPNLKVIVTMFNDRVEYFGQSIEYEEYIDTFVTDNEKVADHYKQKLHKKIPVTVIANGLNCYDEFNPEKFDRDAERKELGVSKDELAIFFVGRLSEEKNPDVFVAVAEELAVSQNDLKLRFFIIGDGPMKPEITASLHKSGNKKIEYLGYQSAVAKYFSSADVFVLPSSIEGFPLSILEAMAMKVAVIASDVGAVAQVVENGKQGYIVEPGSVKEISEALKKLNKDRKKLDDMKLNGRKKVEEKYSNIVLGDNYRRLYKGVIE